MFILVLLGAIFAYTGITSEDVVDPFPKTTKTKPYVIKGLVERLSLDATVSMSKKQGWLVARSNDEKTTWSFAPENHIAYPAYIKTDKRVINDVIETRITTTCGAKRQACEQLVIDYKALPKEQPSRPTLSDIIN
ncbi:hypothetical protein E2K93_00145 [Thalassotalea sp. HSM 43]|uniref:hypothetical protein n=1 Tax=Thalassotalea sp. HSM 43 TaxID=2552945 RepID=UPI00108156A1|nr:hypothetical protein [Thalassotalea sp. HSM 43]QBY02875.1 hypothetical protein E2K93_00145 [Thalassotalea sp. HSM 43]